MIVAAALLASAVRVGGDWDWLVAVGDHVLRTGAVPSTVPFAAADTTGWRDVPVLAQLLVSWLHDAGRAGAPLAHVAAVAAMLTVTAATARARGGRDAGAAVALVVLLVGALASLGVVRAQSFSYLPFALLLALLVRQHRHPDRGIWWAVPLVAVWGNLHGAVLLGTCLLGAHLVVGRLRSRPAETVAVGVASLLALCATPQLWHTPAYYAQVFGNVSAQRGEGLWARPTLGDPLDVAMLAAVAVLLVAFLRSRRPAWEYVAVAGLCVATLDASRHGVWLLLLLAVLAPASGTPRTPTPTGATTPLRAALPAVGVVALAIAVSVPLVLGRGPAVLGARAEVVAAVADVASRTGEGVVLAPSPLSEALAVAGVTLWAGNPLDAFRPRDQAAFLDFVDGLPGGRAAIDRADVVVVEQGSAAERLVSGDPGLRAVPCRLLWTCWVRR